MSAATDCLSYDDKNMLCLDTGWECPGMCDIYFPTKDLGIPDNIEDAEIPPNIVED